MKSIEALMDDGGEITRGPIDAIESAATAADAHNCLAVPVRREGEILNALLRSLDKAIASVLDGGDTIDEINSWEFAAVRVNVGRLAAHEKAVSSAVRSFGSAAERDLIRGVLRWLLGGSKRR